MTAWTHLLIPCALAAALLPTAAAAQAHVGGEVMFVSGRAERLPATGAAQPVAKGTQVLEGDRIRTQPDSHVYVRLRDGGLLVVRPSSELRMDRWRFDPGQPREAQIKYTLEGGVARHVSGEGARQARDKFRFNTPMAAIGVRGTDFTVLADPVVTRISVQSGGVVVSGLGNGCSAEGLGPCEGPSAVELFAGASDKVLQVRMGERSPELVDGPGNAPDKERPAATGEPSAGSRPVVAPLDLAESRANELVASTAEKPLAPPPPIAMWGRWAAIADKDPGVVSVREVLSEGRALVAINRFYVLGTDAASFELPGAGKASFRLAGHDGVISDNVSGQAFASTGSDGALRIDFGTRRFDTSLNVRAGELATSIQATGSVDASGRFSSDPFISSGVVRGLVGGEQAGQAIYLYQRSFGGRYTAAGVASWLK